jgi:hypothetical protein
VQHGGAWALPVRPVGALLGAALAVQHVGAGNFVVAAAHQAQFDLVLHVFNVEGAAARARAHQRADHGLGQLSTVSRTLADAAPCVPCTARKAFIMATAILLGSNGTTAPLRRMIW